MEVEINYDLVKLNEWAKTWLVDFNPKKTKALIITNNTSPDLNLRFDNEKIEIVESHKHLGVTISSDANWKTHIDNISIAASKQVNVLRKLKFTLSRKCLSNIYISFIRPLLEYACEVWDGCYERETEKLEKNQLEAARIVTGLTKFASKEALYFETGWETLSERRKVRKLMIFYRMHKKICPQYLYECLPPLVSEVNNYNLRNNENYSNLRCRLQIMEKSFIPSTIRLWNDLDTSVRNLPRFSLFKRKIRKESFKPPEYYNEGMRKFNIIHTRLRHRCSSLNADLHRVNLLNSPKCSCGAPTEDSIHFFLECKLYQNERMIMFAGFNGLEVNIETILFGNDNYNNKTNSLIFEKVRKYIKESKRF